MFGWLQTAPYGIVTQIMRDVLESGSVRPDVAGNPKQEPVLIARRVDVTVGHRNEAFAEILGGLASGDRVVPYPSDAVRDGVRLKGAQA
jgi:hypothetical protein